MITYISPEASGKSRLPLFSKSELMPVSEIRHFFKDRHGLGKALLERLHQVGHDMSQPAISMFLAGKSTSRAIHLSAHNLIQEIRHRELSTRASRRKAVSE